MEKSKRCNIGLIEMDFFDLNLGVNALGLAHIFILEDIGKRLNIEMHYTIFTQENDKSLHKLLHKLDLENLISHTSHPISLKKISVFYKFCREVKKCDFIIDATGGDSFSDIYGSKRFFRVTICKLLTSHYSKLILAPQTIGPIKYKLNEMLAKKAIKKCDGVFVRDKLSYDFIKRYKNNNVVRLASDVAMLLPYNSTVYYNTKVKNLIDIGINISGLLWNGGYTGKNQFNLVTDYQQFNNRIIKKLIESKQYRIHLIPHVIKDGAYEDDYIVCNHLINVYPELILAPKFETPIDAKNYICKMNIFVGARMHSTIASFSSGIPTIPISYSRKVKGVFSSIGYNVEIDCRKLSTDEAVNKFMKYIIDYKEIGTLMKKPLKTAIRRLRGYQEFLEKEIITLSEK